MDKPDTDPELSAHLAASESALQAILPEDIACVLIIGRAESTDLLISTNVDAAGARQMMRDAQTIGPASRTDLRKVRQ